jgi:hypothetical protein
VGNELNGNLDQWGKEDAFEYPSDTAVTIYFCDAKGSLVLLFLAKG